MADEFKDRIKSIGFLRKKGQSETVPVTDERDGSVGGYHVKHWDGSQDAHVVAKPIGGKSGTPRPGGK